MARSDGSPRGLAVLIPLATIILAIATLHYARDVIVPICLAILITFVLSPVVSRFEKLHLRRVPSAILVSLLFFAGMGTLTWVVARQVVNVAVQFPQYKTNIETKFEAHSGRYSTKLAQLVESFRELESESNPLTPPRPPSGTSESPARTGKKPPAVVVESKPFSFFSSLLGPILAPLVMVGAVIVFTVFMLAERESLRNKLLRLAGRGQLTTTTRALDEAAERVSRYLLLQSLVNLAYGTLVGLGLHFLGVPNAIVWGVLSGILRYVPYLGAIIATSLPSLAALGAFPDWHRALYVLVFYVAIELSTANFIEPYIYGSQTGISAFAILVAAIFWSLIWGPVGLLLSTPLTVCLVAFGRHMPHLEFLTILLGDEPVLEPSVKVYQRLLADDADEALAVANGYLETNSIETLYDSVLIPVLTMEQHDRRSGALVDYQEALVLDNFKELLEDLNHSATTNETSYSEQFARREHIPALVVPVRNDADELGATLLGRLINRHGASIRVLEAEPLRESIERISNIAPEIVCVSSVPPFSLRYTRALYTSLKHMHPAIRVIVGVWAFEGPTMALQERIGIAEPDRISTSLAEAAQQIEEFVGQPRDSKT